MTILPKSECWRGRRQLPGWRRSLENYRARSRYLHMAMGLLLLWLGLTLAVVTAGALVTRPGDRQFLLPGLLLGVMLALLGAVCCAQGLRQQAIRLARQWARSRGRPPWSCDFPWNLSQSHAGAGITVLRQMPDLLMRMVFLLAGGSVFYASAGRLDLPLLIFSPLAVLLAWRIGWTIRALLPRLKYGATSLAFDHFPFVQGRQVGGVFRSSYGAGRRGYLEVEVTLRCLEQRRERRSVLSPYPPACRCDELYCHRMHLMVPDQPRGLEVPIRFDLPRDLPSTCLSGSPQVYWEVEIAVRVDGIPLREQHLVPVYAKPEEVMDEAEVENRERGTGNRGDQTAAQSAP